MKGNTHHVQPFYLVLLLQVSVGMTSAFADDDNQEKGSIKGAVVDIDTRGPLVGVNIVLANTRYRAASDDNGEFVIPNVPVGSYTLKFSSIGYEPLSVTDVIVRPARLSFVDAELTPSLIPGETVVISGGYFPEVKTQPTSVARFSSEEIRRAATIGGDISRIINGLPSLSNENQNNYIVARGGSNVENSFYIDNIRVPNINHFPIPGTTGGGVSLLNIDFIRTIDVYTGGFAAQYGDALSSVMDIRYRDGNRDEADMQTDLNFTGISFGIEGPLAGGNGSYLFSAKHSFTDILFAMIDTDQEPVIYDEVQGKLVYDLSPEHQLSVVHLFGTDRWKILRDEAMSRSENGYGNFGMTENVIGLNWRYVWGKNGFSNTSLSHSFVKKDIRYLTTTDQTERFTYHTTEHQVELRNINYMIPETNHRVEFGFELKGDIGDYDNSFASHTNQLATFIPGIQANNAIRSWNAGLFLNYSWKPTARMDVTPGVRFDYSFYTSRALVSPRLSVAYHIDEKTTVNGAAGLYYQQIPVFFLAQNPAFKELDDMAAYHIVLGLDRLILEDTRLSLEIYQKVYSHCPLDPEQGALFVLDENIYNQFYSYRENLVAVGKAKSSGIELMLQKKLSGQLYGFLSGSYYRATYRDLDGIWRNRITDNRYLFAAEIGYKPSPEWEFNVRWSYAGGIPYTPYDQQASQNARSGIYDTSEITGQRLPAYSCLNVRVDKRFYFQGSNLIVYLSIWNLLDRENVSYHYWDEYAGSAGNYTQWPRLPVFGFEFEF
jgi:outer membrane receptor for ferrienterochelin and colicin